MMWVFIITVIVVSIASFIWSRKRNAQLFKRLGIPGPEPNIIFGNALEAGSMGFGKCIQKWAKEYGTYFGYFEGPMPILVSSDIEFLKQVFIKHFNNFNVRKYFPMSDDPEYGDSDVHLFVAEGKRWKRQRMFINPTFSTSKLKQLSIQVNRSADDMISLLEKEAQEDKPTNVYPFFQDLTLEVIMACGFGVDSQTDKALHAHFKLQCIRIFEYFQPTTPLILLALLFPELGRLWFAIKFIYPTKFDVDPMSWLKSSVTQIVNHRKQQPEADKRVDFLQLMINAEETEEDTAAEGTETGDGTQSKKGWDLSFSRLFRSIGRKKINWAERKKLTTNEITANSALLMFAGYETTSTALAYTTYELALHPEIQEKMYEELKGAGLQERIEYNDLSNLPYLDMVFSEVLRIHVIVPSIPGRRCMEDCTINGVFIPKGVCVLPDIHTIHNDPELWGPRDPKDFYPERFLPELKAARHPMAYLPFGAGPRNCVGLRFALMEAKITLAKLIRKFRIVRCDEMEVPLQTKELGTVTPKNGVPVKLELRN